MPWNLDLLPVRADGLVLQPVGSINEQRLGTALAQVALLPAGMVLRPFTLTNSGDCSLPSQVDADPAAWRGDVLVSSSDVLPLC